MEIKIENKAIPIPKAGSDSATRIPNAGTNHVRDVEKGGSATPRKSETSQDDADNSSNRGSNQEKSTAKHGGSGRRESVEDRAEQEAKRKYKVYREDFTFDAWDWVTKMDRGIEGYMWSKINPEAIDDNTERLHEPTDDELIQMFKDQGMYTEKEAIALLKDYIQKRSAQGSSLYEFEQWLLGNNIQGAPIDFYNDISALASAALASLFKITSKTEIPSGTLAIWMSYIMDHAAKKYLNDKFGRAFEAIRNFKIKHPNFKFKTQLPDDIYDLFRHDTPYGLWKQYAEPVETPYIKWLKEIGRYDEVKQRWDNTKESRDYHPTAMDVLRDWIASRHVSGHSQSRSGGGKTKGGGAGRRS